jgi:hypothetical protein
MTGPDDPLCARVFERMVENGDLGGDAALLAHAGSCMACFRTLTELRDAARLKELLRASPPAQPPAGDPLWDQLASQITAAVRADKTPVRPASSPSPAVRPWRRRWISGSVGLALLAAAAAWVLAVRPARREPGSAAPAAAPVTLSAVTSPLAADDSSAALDVSELDGAVLKRLADRLREKPLLATYVLGEEADVEEDVQLSDEVAGLDGPALLRLQRSLARTAL